MKYRRRFAINKCLQNKIERLLIRGSLPSEIAKQCNISTDRAMRLIMVYGLENLFLPHARAIAKTAAGLPLHEASICHGATPKEVQFSVRLVSENPQIH